ncbi:MAG: Fic family protein [Gemmatimonadaceae bacterium]
MRQLTEASRQLAELKGVAASIPNQRILISTLGIQEAKDSSAIENIVTTHDELFREASQTGAPTNPAAKEVLRYRQALQVGFDLVKKDGLITNNHLLRIQAELEQNSAGFRRVAGTTLKDGAGRVVYTPPQDAHRIVELMTELEAFINAPPSREMDPLVRMAIIHHRFESIHPFYDGNGRTGRILNVLYLVKEGLLDIPVLYMSRHIVRTKSEYYRLLQGVRDAAGWEEWVTYMLTAVAESAREGITTVHAIGDALLEVKHRVRKDFKKFYSQDLINNIFSHPYTKIQFVREELGVSRLTATKYLDALAGAGILEKMKVGRSSFYVNVRLAAILTEPSPPAV